MAGHPRHSPGYPDPASFDNLSSGSVAGMEEGLTTGVKRTSARLEQLHAIFGSEGAAIAKQRDIVDQTSPFVVALALLFGLAAGWWLSRRLARSILLPLSTLTHAAERIGAEVQIPRVVLRGPREIEALGSAFNDMAEQLAERQTAVERHQRLLALMENAADGILVVSSDGHVGLRHPWPQLGLCHRGHAYIRATRYRPSGRPGSFAAGLGADAGRRRGKNLRRGSSIAR